MLVRALSTFGLLLALVVAGAAPVQADRVPQSRSEIDLSFAPLVRKVGPAVVNVYSRATVTERPGLSPLFEDPFFKRFFGDMMPKLPERRREANSLGSGVLVDPAGIVVTNNHVVEKADEITVVLADRREFPARLLLADPKTDLAVLKIEAGDEDLPAVAMRDSDDLEVGDIVLAIGNPFGVGQTVTMGIVSALARTNVGITDYSFFIQTDASINPGNSGGALIGMDGRLVGVNTAIFSNQRGGAAGSVGIGFAIPSNMVATVLRAAKSGKIVRPWLGARTQTVTTDLAQGLGLDRPVGALIGDVYPGGPAARAGLRTGDVILEVDEREVSDAGTLRYRVGTRKPGETITLQAMRNGRVFTARLPMEAPQAEPSPNVSDLTGRSPMAGARVANMSPAFAIEEGFDELARGVVVLGTARGSPAERLGLRRGDLVVSVNDRPIDRVNTLDRALNSAQGSWTLSIRRDDRVLTTRVQG
ncbi:DegQ family serine endoprotease [Thalassobaculum fulvum]|uniref:DegQ family serine endoprotease n=1 Tax=Thalassobaculum fulvum TaxID=1633335 RepID=UPI00167A867E|nr:DegQ family serine endoprotease [Thalassobaculum fulvum]